MTSHEVLVLYRAAARSGIRLWIDGGWCVDALVGEQTRQHDDLDVAVNRDDVTRLVAVFSEVGYRQCDLSTSEWNFVMANDRGQRIDLHVFHFDAAGHLDYGVAYPARALRGIGVINGEQVECITAESMYQFKAGYEPAAKDRSDIRQLEKVLAKSPRRRSRI
ncbi:MAG: aminoglycoside nucleotidyltransferase [Mycobacterium sp.]